MKVLKDKVAAITGAGSGIGRGLAARMAAQGCNLALSDINPEELRETAALTGRQVRVSTHVMDVADRAQVYQYADDVVREHGGVDIIVNNAGVVLANTVEGTSYEDFEWLVGINFWGVVYGTKAFLPYIRKRPEGHIVNISSVNGITPMPYGCAYNAAKFAIRGFTDTLTQELRGTSITATVVHPGGVKTNIARKARYHIHANRSNRREDFIAIFEKNAMTSPDRAARIIISGMKRNKARIIVGPDARICDYMTRLFPIFTLGLVARFVHKLG